MGTILLLAVAVLLPTGVGYGAVAIRAAYRRWLASRPPLPNTRPIERISRDLRRLRDQLQVVENAPPDMPSKNHRCRATRAAYLDALVGACVQLDIAPPVGRPVPDAEIYRVEADLRRCGLDVRPVA